jgi:hypothetical protein
VRGKLLIHIVATSHGTNYIDMSFMQEKKLYTASLSPVTKDFAAGD